MKRAIITGATGVVGSAVAKHLSASGIDVLCLGRQKLNASDVKSNFGVNSTYLRLEMKDILLLEKELGNINWPLGDSCVFFNFAWGGDQKLTDGGFSVQITNAIYAAHAVQTAKRIGCNKFVNCGTLEESYVELYLGDKSNKTYQISQVDYALAKLASRDMCKIVSYIEKIDYVHTRLSVPLVSNLSKGSYVAKTLRNIIAGISYVEPESKRLFDITLLDDIAVAYQLIGIRGKNKADYFIGTSRPATLKEYFEFFEKYLAGLDIIALKNTDSVEKFFFSTEDLLRDTGFIATERVEDIIKKLNIS